MKKFLGVLVVLVIVAGGYVYISNNQSAPDTTNIVTTNDTKPTQVVVTTSTSTSMEAKATTTVETAKKPTTTSVNTTSTTTKPTPKPVTATPPQKNIYRHASAGYSIEIPTGWVGKAEDTGNAQIFATDFVDPSGTITNDDIAFVVTATPVKLQNDAYVQASGKTPTNKDLLAMFLADQKDNVDGWALVDESPVTLSGLSGYSYTATYGNGYATSKAYMLFGANYIYLVKADMQTSKLASTFPTYKSYMLTFSAR